MNIQETNYWLETVREPARGTSDPLAESVDVAVVGAGFCGLSAARVLAKRGVRVAVLEAEALGWGASCRNGGMVLTGMKLPVPTLIARYGRETVRRMYAASLESIDLVEQIVKEEGIDCGFSRCGHLEVACKPSHFAAYAEAAAVMAANGVICGSAVRANTLFSGNAVLSGSSVRSGAVLPGAGQDGRPQPRKIGGYRRRTPVAS